MWLPAAAVGNVGRIDGHAQAYYRVHQESMQRTLFAGQMTDLEGRQAAFEKMLVGPEARVTRGEQLFGRAWRRLAVPALNYACVAHEERCADLEPVDEYVAFAERVWPAARKLRKSRSAERRATAGADRLERSVSGKSRRAMTDFTRRLRWRRWRWSGV